MKNDYISSIISEKKGNFFICQNKMRINPLHNLWNAIFSNISIFNKIESHFTSINFWKFSMWTLKWTLTCQKKNERERERERKIFIWTWTRTWTGIWAVNANVNVNAEKPWFTNALDFTKIYKKRLRIKIDNNKFT